LWFPGLIACWRGGRCSDEVNPRKQPYKISNQRLRELGLEFTPAAQALYDTVVCFQEKGILPLPVPAPTPASPDA
jgi:cinnamoyl-CoA reductase